MEKYLDEMKGRYNIVKAAVWYTVGNILIKGVSFFVLPVFTRLMSPYEYGIYGVYTSYLAIFEVVALLGLSATVSIARYSGDTDFDSYMSTAVTIPFIFTGITALLVNVWLGMFHTLLSMNAVLWNCLMLTSAFGAVFNIMGARLVIEGEYRMYMASSLISTVGNVAVSFLLCFTVYRMQDAHMARILGGLAANAAGAMYLLYSTGTRFRFRLRYTEQALRWGIPLLFHTLATVVLTQSDRILVRYMDSYSSAGIYSIAVTMASIPLVLQTSFGHAWNPWFFEKLKDRKYEDIRNMSDRYILLFAFLIVEFMLLAPEIIHVFTDASYWDSVYSLVPLAVSVFGEMLYSLPVGVEYFNKKTTSILSGTLAAVCVNVILDISFIKTFGYIGAAYATALSKLALFFFHSVVAHRIDREWVFRRRTAALCLAFLILADIFVVTCSRMVFMRLGAAVILAVLALLWIGRYRDAVKRYIKV